MTMVPVHDSTGAHSTPASTLPCPACGSTVVDTIEMMHVRAQHLAYARGDAWAAQRLDEAFGQATACYDVRRCEGCELEFADPPLAPAQAWYAELYALLHLYPADRWEYGVVRDSLGREDAVVDYGCGNGHFLLSLRDRAGQATGFDFSHAAVQAAVSRGLAAQVLDLDGRHRGPPLPAPASHVTAFHVLEHLARPDALFRFARTVGGPSARLWIAVPSDRRASRRYAEADALDAPPHHLTRWTEASLRAMGHRHGWTLARHLYEPLPAAVAVWESTRRLPIFHRIRLPWRPLERAARRALAVGVWTSGLHRRVDASGFSMLACFRPSESG